MKCWLYALLLVLLCRAALRGQDVSGGPDSPTGPAAAPAGVAGPGGEAAQGTQGFGEMPVDIVNSQETHFENGVAIAEGDVVIQYGTTTIYADYGEYHPDTHDVFVRGHVRIYREGEVFVGERAVYNMETKELHAANFQGDMYPFRFSAESLSSIGPNAYLAKNTTFTTSDSSVPDYQLRATSARIYPGQRIILRNVKLYVGNLPVFWWPYLYQPLRRDMSYSIHPGFYSQWGFFALSSWNFPISDNWNGRLELDWRAQRGPAIGLNTDYRFGQDNRSWGRFISYFAPDQTPPTVTVGNNKDRVNAERYRVSVQDRVYINDDLWASININKLSDVRMLRDFLPNVYRLDPQPDNVVNLTQWNGKYTFEVTYRKQLNDFNDVTERLPDVSFDVTRQAVRPGSNLFYDSSTSAGRYRLAFATGSAFPDYHYDRIDTYHELVYPMEFWNFLSFVPRLGLRGDYYTNQGQFSTEVRDTTVENLLPNNVLQPTVVQTTINKLTTHGALFRGVIDGGFETSFKMSRDYPRVESEAWGLDDLRHIVQPYMDVSLAATSADPGKILQIDRFQPSTELPMFDFPQFTGIDTISNWAIVQLGIRNNLDTKRDNTTFQWLSLDTHLDVNLKQPYFATGTFHQGPISNLYNELTFYPLPWLTFAVNAQTPMNSHGFNQVNSSIYYMASKDTQFSLGNEYLDHDPYFRSENLIDVGLYYRINDNWSISTRDEYEVVNNTLQNEVYEVHRDLSSFVASMGVQVENNGPGGNPRILYAFMFTLTLKAIPSATLPFDFDPSSIGNKSP